MANMVAGLSKSDLKAAVSIFERMISDQAVDQIRKAMAAGRTMIVDGNGAAAQPPDRPDLYPENAQESK